MRAVRRTLGIAAAAATLAFTAQAAAQTPPTGGRSEARGAGRSRPGSRSRSRIAFLGDNDFFVIEKATGKVKRITGGAPPVGCSTSPVNSASERGLLGITLDKYFRHNGFVYLYWTREPLPARTAPPWPTCDDAGQPARPLQVERHDADPDKTLLRMRAFQTDAGQPERGNHNGGADPHRAGRQDLPDRRRHRSPRPDAEPDRRPVRLPAPDGRRRATSATTSSAARTPTTSISRA